MRKKIIENDDNYFMKMAIREAMSAELIGEVPIGAVIVKDGEVIARGHNKRIKDSDATAHAEIVAIRRAGKKIKNWRLDGCTLYVTLEPCAMCAGALINSRIDRLVYGAKDVRFGCCGSLCNLVENNGFNHNLQVDGGICGAECGEILSTFFKAKRNRNKEQREE